jgi:ATP-binding protein involved in chromosome partitioning
MTDYDAAGTGPEAHGALNGRLIDEVRHNLAQVGALIAIASAKGGCGKSTLAVNLAVSLAGRGRKVGIIDADVGDPSVAAMLGIARTRVFPMMGVIDAVAGPLGLRVIGADLIAADDPVELSVDSEASPDTNGFNPHKLHEPATLASMLAHTRFGTLDTLIVDLASGLDSLRRLAELIPPSAVIVVTQSSSMAVNATRRMIESARNEAVPIAGVVENMTGYYCEHCRSLRPLMPNGDLGSVAHGLGVTLLARIPFDARIAEGGDRGAPFVRDFADTPVGHQFADIAAAAEDAVANRTAKMPAESPG